MKIQKIDGIADNHARLMLAVALIMFAVFFRLMPHPPNFAPVAAVAIFGGAILPRRWALILPLLVMMVSDLIIGLHPLILFTWGSFAAIALLSSRFVHKIKPRTIVGASLGGSLLFYLVTNFGVWLQGQMYAINLSGLIDCYYKAIPFFRNTMLGDLVFTGMLFGVYGLVQMAVPARKSLKQVH